MLFRASVLVKKLRGPGTFTVPGLLETDVLLAHQGAVGEEEVVEVEVIKTGSIQTEGRRG